jgi:hypothetical protein
LAVSTTRSVVAKSSGGGRPLLGYLVYRYRVWRY